MMVRVRIQRKWLRNTLRAAIVLLVAATSVAIVGWRTAPSTEDLGSRASSAAGPQPAVEAGEISTPLRDAVVATEDERFYRHHGVDLIGILRAIPYDLVHLSLAQGASTITEQTAKVLYLNGDDHSPLRKLRSAFIALRMESGHSKGQILAAYLSSVYLGEGSYGVQAASSRYFDVPASRLTLAQASLLAGLIQAPSAYDPFVHPAAARDRQQHVLTSMVRNGYTTSQEAEAVLRHRLPMSNGKALAPVPHATISAAPRANESRLTWGLILSTVSLGFLLLRRRLNIAPPWRIAVATGLFVGAVSTVMAAHHFV